MNTLTSDSNSISSVWFGYYQFTESYNTHNWDLLCLRHILGGESSGEQEVTANGHKVSF